jgi:UDP-N-acetylglucosamine 4,6-dehydratase/5-epimerase
MGMAILSDKVVLITGGTGSFGRAFIRRVLDQQQPRKLIVFSRDECKQWEMQQEGGCFAAPCLRYFLGDMRDGARLRRALEGVDFVIHAAALKQVVAAEYNPSEFVKTNVLGAMNLVEAAIDAGVKRVIALSTDKAVNPVNLYGATKLCADKLLAAGNVYVGARGYPRFSVVRYGNVLGSRGSVLDSWQRLVRSGATTLPVTDRRMTRFWITLEEAIDFVLLALEEMRGGEILVPKCPSMRIIDLAEAVAPGAGLEIQGVRAGEKIHEVLVSAEEAERTLEWERYYLIVNGGSQEGTKVAPGFVYTSDTNHHWLDPDALRRRLEGQRLFV